jgi:succinate-acetate transporter protein
VWSVSSLALLSGPPGATNAALGMFLLVAAILLALLLLSAGTSQIVFVLVIARGCVRLTLTGLYEIEASRGQETAAVIAGLVLAAAAAYGIITLLSEDLPGRGLLPSAVAAGRGVSISDGLDQQLEDLENEPGARRQL